MTDTREGGRCPNRRCPGRALTRRPGPARHSKTAAFLHQVPRAVLLASAPLLFVAARHARADDPSAPPIVHVAVASDIAWPTVVTVPATVSAVDVAVLASRTGGWVTRVNVAAGARVAQDAPLLAVGLPIAQEQRAAAEARVSASQAAFDEAAADQHRFSVLHRTHATSDRQYDAAERAFITAKAELAAAQSALAAARSNLGYADIRAPFAGTVVEKTVRQGAFATPGAPLLTIAGTTPEIRAYVGPDTYGALKTGEAAEVDIDGTTEPAVITRVVAAADPDSHTHLVELHLPSGASAPFGAFAELHLTVDRHPQLTVPEAALTQRAGLRGVFVVDSGNRAHFRLVRTSAAHDGRIAVVAGLAPGESVVLAPPADLVSDAPVRPETHAASLPTDTSRD